MSVYLDQLHRCFLSDQWQAWCFKQLYHPPVLTAHLFAVTEPMKTRSWRPSTNNGLAFAVTLSRSCECQARSFVLCRQGSSLLWTQALRPFWIGPMCQPRKRKGVDRCVWCERYVGWRRLSRLQQLVSILNVPPLGVAYCLTKPGLALVQRQPWPVHRSAPGPDWHLFSASRTGLPFSAQPPDLHICSVS